MPVVLFDILNLIKHGILSSILRYPSFCEISCIAYWFRRISPDDSSSGNVFGNNAATRNNSPFSDSNAWHYLAIPADADVIFDFNRIEVRENFPRYPYSMFRA